ncbi:MAG: AAA family ATPase [Aureispira sp.]
MRLTLKDIGIVHSAELELNGLTVIAGENGIGKSAVGKALYCALQSDRNLEAKSTIEEKSSVFVMMSVLSGLQESAKQENISEDMLRPFLNTAKNPEIRQFLEDIIRGKTNVSNTSEIVHLIKQMLPTPANNQDYIQQKTIEHNHLIQSVFSNQYNNVLVEGNSSTCEIQINKDNTSKTQLTIVTNNETQKYHAQDAVLDMKVALIETPTILSQYRYIKENLAFNNNQNKLLPDYNRDLIQKLSESSYNPDYTKPICQTIQSIIKGRILLENDQLFYQDQQANKHPIQNVATGIKSLGMLQLLLAGSAIAKDTVLIIDEPEVHLHPSWQLDYAKIIVELVKEGVLVLITSHSSYLIQALDIYTTNEGITQQTNFYLGQMTPRGSVFEEVTENLEAIYKAFAAPSLQLMLERSRGKRQGQVKQQQARTASLVQEDKATYKKKEK